MSGSTVGVSQTEVGAAACGGGTQTHLRIDVEERALPLCCADIPDGLYRGAVHVAAEDGVLEEGSLGYQVLELGAGNVVVVHTRFLSRAGRPGGVCGVGAGRPVGVMR